MRQTQSPCVVCGEAALRTRQVQLSYGAISQCPRCGCGLLDPRPTAADLGQLHGDDDYFNHPYFEARRELTPTVRESCETKLAGIEAYAGALNHKALVDVGCDLGVFVAYAAESRSMQSLGVDIIPKVVELGQAARRDLRVGTLHASEPAVGSRALNLAIRSVFYLARLIGAPTLLTAMARKPQQAIT